MAKWFKTEHKGIRYYEHPTRKHGVRRDRYYAIRFQVDGRTVEEALGWSSQGVTLEKAILKRTELMKSKREGTGPRTLREDREQNVAIREAETAKLLAEAEANRTLSQYWDESYLPAAKRSKKECSWSKEESHFVHWIGPLLGKLPLRSIGLSQWDELVKTLSAAGLSPRTKEYATGTLRRILKHAYDRRMVDDAVPTGKRIGVSGPGNNRRLRVISHDEESAIMQQLATLDVCAWRITRFCFLTGCRASEAFGLTWGNVDVEQCSLMFVDTKNRDTRTLPLTAPLFELLSSMSRGTPGERVFLKPDGSAYYQAPRVFKQVVAGLGLNDGRSKRDRLVFHSIRHTVATRLAQRLGPRDLMDVMGWRTVIMAMRYVHGNQDAKMKALAMLGTAPLANVVPFRVAGGEI